MKTPIKHTLLLTALALTFGPGRALAQRPIGVDVSSYQGGSINWSSVKSSGRSFAWAKATGGTGIIDGDFPKNEDNGKDAGLYMGAYHFAYPDLNTPGGEAAYFWKEAGGYIKNDGKTLMPMLDMEEFSGLDGASSYTAWANDWCADVVSDANAKGVTIQPIVYVSACNASHFTSSITGLPWIADYNGESAQTGTPWSTCSGDDVWGSGVWDLWQYSSSGSVSGISGSVDEDVFNGTSAQLVSTLLVGKRVTYADYDGDGKADPALWEPGNGYWYIQGSKGVSWDVQWGTNGDIPVPADYDGDGITDPAVFRPSNGTWYVHGSKGTSWAVQFGEAGDIPVPGDYDGDGLADFVIFRPSTGTWWFDCTSKGVFTNSWGTNGDIPVARDYDGDGITDAAVWRPSNGYWYIAGSMGVNWAVQYGEPGDIPVPGDYDGDGLSDFVVYRPSNNLWYLNCTSAGAFTKTYGFNTDIAQSADYDGDGIADIAIWRPSDLYWYIKGSEGTNWATQWGQVYMQPVNLASSIYNVFYLKPSITTQPVNETVNAGQNATFSVAVTGSAPLSYQWNFDSANISGAITNSYTVTNAQSANAGSYAVVVTNKNGSVTSSVVTLTVNPVGVAPNITNQPASETVNQGQTAGFSVVAGGTAPLSYQWQFNGTNVSGATASSYTVTTNAQSTNAGSYTVVITNVAGAVTSSVAILTVIIPPSITTQPADLSVTAGSNATFSVVAAGTAPLSYQWAFNGSNILGATSTSYTVTNAQPTNAGEYSVVVTNLGGSLTSTNAVLMVNIPPSITTQPTNMTVNQGQPASFSVLPAGTSPFAYQWTFNGGNIPGATDSSYSLASAQGTDAGSYAVVVTNAAGTVTSSTAVLTVIIPPSITTQPANQTVNQGQNATFSVVATGTSPSYQWSFNGSSISGATASSYTVTSAQTSNVGSYSVVVTNAAGTVTSSNATLTVIIPPSITTQPANQTANQGQNATFSVVAAGTSPLSYQWEFNGANISSATNSSYTVSDAQSSNAGSYLVVVTNAAGAVTSSVATLTVDIPPSITTQPANKTVNQTQNATFSVVAAGTAPLSYQWTFDGATISGATASSYTVNNVASGNAGSYAVVVTNVAGTITSSTATLTMNVTNGSTIDVFAQGSPSGSGVDHISWSSAGSGNWSGWVGAGPVGTGKPAVCSYLSGYLNVFARGTNNALWTKYYYPAGGWSAWSSLGGNMASDPCAVVWRGGTNYIFVFYQGTNNQIVERYWDSITGWNSGEVSHGGTPVAGGAPTACSYEYGYLNLFIRSTNNALYTTYYAPTGWQGSWSSLGGTLTSDPGATSWGMQRIDVFAQGSPSGSAVNHISWNTSGWSSWSSIGAVGTGAPAVCSYASNYLNVFATGTNNSIWTKYYSPSGWGTSWTSLGGSMTSDPCCVSWTTGN